MNFEVGLVEDLKWDPKTFLRHARNNIVHCHESTKVMQADGTLTRNNQELACVLSKFSASVFHSDDRHPVPQIPILVLHIPELSITAQMVQAHLEWLSTHKSGGPSSIANFLWSSASLCSASFAHPYIHQWSSRFYHLALPNLNIFTKALGLHHLLLCWMIRETQYRCY